MDQCDAALEKREYGNQFDQNIKEENGITHTSLYCDPNLVGLLDSNWTENCINEYDTSLVVCKEEILYPILENEVVNDDIVDPNLPATCSRTVDNNELIENIQNEKLLCTETKSNDYVHLENTSEESHVDCSQENLDIQEECTRVLASHLAKISAVRQKNKERSVRSKKENSVRSSRFYIIEERTISEIGKHNFGGLTSPEKDNDTTRKQNRTILETNKSSYNLRHRKSKEPTVPLKTLTTIRNPNKVITNAATKKKKLKKNKIGINKDVLKDKIKTVIGERNVIRNKSLTRNSNKNDENLTKNNNFPITNDNIVESEIENIDAHQNKSLRNTKFGNSNKHNVTDSNKHTSKKVTPQKNKIAPGVKKSKDINNKSIKMKLRTINKENDSVQNILPTVRQKKVKRNVNKKKISNTVKSSSKIEKVVSLKAKLGKKQNKPSTKRILNNEKQNETKSKKKLPANKKNNNTDPLTITEYLQSVKSTDNMTPEDIKNLHAEYMRVFKNEYICDICDYRTSRRKYIECHLMVHNGAVPKKILCCEYCGYITNFKHYLENHMRLHTGEKRYICGICNFKFSRKCHLNSHINTHSENKRYSCNICNYRCNRKDQLTVHKITHTIDRPFSCMFCSFRGTRKETVVSHMKTHTGEKCFHCDMCNFKFLRKQCLINHIMVHNKEKPFSCKYCEYKCVRKVDLVIHERKHTGDKPYPCKLCDYKTTRKITLVYHMRTHTGDRPFSCKLCSYKGRQHHQLIVHMRTHTGEKPFHCNKCSYRCADKSSLNKHTRVHTQEKPHVCDQCHRRFKDTSNLKRHIKTHASDRIFWCGLCQFKSIEKCDLIIHMNKHNKKN